MVQVGGDPVVGRSADPFFLSNPESIFMKLLKHVALVSGPGELIHANAFHMAVCREPIAQAIARIARQGGGPVIAHKRP